MIDFQSESLSSIIAVCLLRFVIFENIVRMSPLFEVFSTGFFFGTIFRFFRCGWSWMPFSRYISDAIQNKGVKNLPTLDTFDDIDPLVEEVNMLDIVYDESSLATNQYITHYESNSDSEWEDEDGNILID